jgi:transposase
VLTLGLTGRIWVAVAPVDARKSFDTLAAVVTASLSRDPLSGDLFVWPSRSPFPRG